MNTSLKKYAVIVAGGSGTRMGAAIPKQFLMLNGQQVISHTIASFLHAYDDLEVILVLPAEFASTMPMQERVKIVNGGPTRFHSVKNGLAAIHDDKAIVFIHDGVRCLVTKELIQRCYIAATEKGNAVPAIKAVDSLRMETEHGNKIIDRNQVRIIQTPQTFEINLIKAAFEQEYDETFTDEASVLEKTGTAINLIEGETDNIKITRPIDLFVAEKILSGR